MLFRIWINICCERPCDPCCEHVLFLIHVHLQMLNDMELQMQMNRHFPMAEQRHSRVAKKCEHLCLAGVSKKILTLKNLVFEEVCPLPLFFFSFSQQLCCECYARCAWCEAAHGVQFKGSLWSTGLFSLFLFFLFFLLLLFLQTSTLYGLISIPNSIPIFIQFFCFDINGLANSNKLESSGFSIFFQTFVQ